MHTASPLLRLLLALLVTLPWPGWLTASDSPRSAGLALTCEMGGRAMPLARVERESLLLASDDGMITAPVRAEARWSVAGDVRALAHLLRWSPNYTLARDERVEVPWYRARVSVTRSIDIAPQPDQVRDARLRSVAETLHRTPDPFTVDWPDGPDRPAAVVAVWIVHDHIVHTLVEAVPHPGEKSGFRLTFDFSLSPEEAVGQPAVLLWRDGQFIAPTSRFKHPATETASHAVMFNDTTALAAALSAGAKVDATTTSGRITLAHLAAECGAVEALKLLVDARPKILDAMTEEGATPTRWAASKGRLNVLRWLVAHHGNKAIPKKLAEAVLGDAIEHGHADAVDLLLPIVYPPGSQAANVAFPLVEGAWDTGYADVIRLLAARLPSLPPQSKNVRPQESTDSQDGNENSTGPDLGIRQSDAEKLGIAGNAHAQVVQHATRGHLPMVKMLLATEGIDVNFHGDGMTAVLGAAMNGHAQVVRELLAHGADPARAGHRGMTPLMVASRGHRPDIAADLLKAGARPNTVNDEGMTALHYAAERNETALVALLLDSGADMLICNIREITPLDLALFSGATDSVQLLMNRGACIGLGAPYSLDLLQAAISNDIAAPIATALEQGWPPISTFAGTWPALRVAELLGAEQCARVLRAAGANAQADRPMPVVDAAELDAPLNLITAATPVDLRPPDAVFPATVIRIRLLVDGQGRGLFPKPLERGDPLATLAILKASLKTRYSPPRHHGQPVATFAILEFALPASRDRVFDESEVDRAPTDRFVSVRPYLPLSASTKDRDAQVVVDYVINAEGRAEQVTFLKTSGPSYSDAVLLAMAQWRFTPAMHHGTAVAVRRNHAFSFDPKAH